MMIIFFLILFFSMLISLQKPNSLINNTYSNNFLLFLVIIVFSIEIYLVNTNNIPDYQTYEKWFNLSKYLSYSQLNLFENRDSLFFLLLWVYSKISSNFNLFILLVWITISIILLKTFRNIFSGNEILFVFLSYTNYFVFFSYVLNTMRQGIAIATLLLLISYLYFYPKNKWTIFGLSIIAPLIHLSAILPVIIILIYKVIKPKLNVVFFIWILSIMISLTSLNKYLFSRVNIDILNTYSSIDNIARYGEVNRIDFILFSVVFGLLFYWIAKKTKIQSYKIEELTSTYLLLNSYFLLLAFIAYSDRIAAFSWFIIPIIIWKSVFKERREVLNFVTFAIFIILGIVTKSYLIFL